MTEPPVAPANIDGADEFKPASDGGLPPGDSVIRGEKLNTRKTITRHRKNRSRRLLEWVVVIVIAVIVAALLRALVVQAFYVPSGSMLPTLQVGDRIIVVKVGYTIHRGDIIVFRRTPADTSTTDADLVKRVIGLPGETISSRGATVLINGKALKEAWLPRLTAQRTPQGTVDCTETAENIPPTMIAPGHYYVMGDCRGNSDDSRDWGTVPASYIVGKVFVIVWRFGHPYLHSF